MKEIYGTFVVDNKGYDDMFEVMFSSDKYGEYLSIRSSNLTMIVPYEEVEELVRETRNAEGRSGQKI